MIEEMKTCEKLIKKMNIFLD